MICITIGSNIVDTSNWSNSIQLKFKKNSSILKVAYNFYNNFPTYRPNTDCNKSAFQRIKFNFKRVWYISINYLKSVFFQLPILFCTFLYSVCVLNVWRETYVYKFVKSTFFSVEFKKAPKHINKTLIDKAI